MNNLLKIFLIFNLFSSATSSANNSSLLLPETELKMGQNSSELVEREQPTKIFTSGGLRVKIFTFYGGNFYPGQRDCTLSFPVRDKHHRYLGYLTSWNCGNDDVFSGSTQVGLAQLPANFDPKKGLDYVFVGIRDSYWDKEVSPSVAFNEVFNNDKFDFLPMTASTQPPLGATVCAYGGGGRFSCGMIVDLNSNIQVSVPWEKSSGGRYNTAQFFGVVKVLMESNKNYQPSDLGAPVYIPAQIPFQSRLVVAPVGMVVENIGESSEKNAWYYIPIDRILQDSGLELLLGDFSGNGDDLSIGNNYPKEVPMGGKSSNPGLQERQPYYPTVHCGDGVKIMTERNLGKGKSKTCTLGFAVKKIGGHGFDNGYLTLGCCSPSSPAKHGNAINVYGSNNLVIGKTYNSLANLEYDPAKGLDYFILRITEPKVLSGLSAGITSHDLNQPPVIKTLDPILNPAKGMEICYSGSYSGLVCGELVSVDSVVARGDPWMFAPQLQMDYFLRVGIVGLKTPPYFPVFNRRTEDFGAPVFVPVYDQCDPENAKQIIAAHPVGLLEDQSLIPFVVPFFRGAEPYAKLIPFSFYYQPLEIILADKPNLRLIISPKAKNSDSITNSDCPSESR